MSHAFPETRVFFFLAQVIIGPTALAVKKWTLSHVLTEVFKIIFNDFLCHYHMFQLSRFQRLAPVLLFITGISCFEMILIWMSDIYKFCELITLFISWTWKSWLSYDIKCLRCSWPPPSSWAVDSCQQKPLLFRHYQTNRREQVWESIRCNF